MSGRSTSTSRISRAERVGRLPVTTTETEDLLRRLAPQVLGAVVRRYGNFDLAEDATQEALVAASVQWPEGGRPDNPRAWLITVASRRLTDLLRSEQARRQREGTVARWALTERGGPRPDEPAAAATDDTLVLLLLCCHPSLSVASQIALTLRAVGGLSTAEIARALLGSEQTVTRRITRAKQAIKDSGIPFARPAPAELEGRLSAVLRVLYLIFNEGYAGTSGTTLMRVDLAQEAIRLARMIYAARPDDSEVAGLLALMLLIHARHRARTAPDGSLIPMGEQDRSRWDRDAIGEGIELVTAALPRGPIGPYQLQAAIAAVHDEAEDAEATDWRQIAALYGALLRLDDNPVVALNHAVAVSMVAGPGVGLDLVQRLGTDARINTDRRFHSVRGHLLEMAGDRGGALEAYQAAARVATNLQQQRYLNQQITRLQAPR
jgi:RNA polymerase sigma factor (sigma-70 family)